MDFTHVICTVSIMLSSGYRDVVSLHGIVLKESDGHLMVDFGDEFVKRHYDTQLQSMVQGINENDCLYTK